MRETDPPHPPWQPLGPATPRSATAPPKPMTPARGEYGVTEGPDGKLKTTKNPNP